MFFKCIAFTLLLFAVVLPTIDPFNIHERIPENEQWRCLNCTETGLSNRQIFAFVRRALMRESREVYLNFDHSWIDDNIIFRNRKSAVEVRVIDRSQLAKFDAERDIPNVTDSTTNDPNKEIFRVIISFPDASMSERTAAPEIEWLDEFGAAIIDNFLTRNPCFIPIKDPYVLPIYNDSKASYDKSQIYYNNGPPRLFHDFYDNAAIFIRLPNHGFAATCAFYTYLTKRQFFHDKEGCPLTTSVDKNDMSKVFNNVEHDLKRGGGYDHYLVYKLGIIGWSNNIHPFIEHFKQALRNNQVLVTPMSQNFGTKTYTPEVKLANGSVADIEGKWLTWTRLGECPKEISAWDPWNCHFLSLSNCNNEETHYLDFNYIALVKTDVDQSYLSFFKTHLQNLRERFNDALLLEEYWEDMRLMLFIQRPNIYLRAKLRWSLLSLKFLPSRGVNSNSNSSSVSSSVSSIDYQLLPRPCLGLHVRHGDSKNDFRGRTKLNRTLEAHVECMNNLTTGLDIRNIVIASDNATVIQVAPSLYMKYNWYSQIRAIPEFDGRSFNYIKEPSIQKEVANLFADLIVISRCSGIVATGDSAYTLLMNQYQCSRSLVGECPPLHKLWNCQWNISSGY